MLQRDVVTLDLGSAYSKLAVRRGEGGDAMLLTDLPFAQPETPFIVPSVVAQLKSGEVLVGWPAWRQTQSSGARIWRNWKASLVLGQEMNGIAPDEAAEVAYHYLDGLRSLLRIHDANLPLRICVPALGRTEAAADTFAEIARRTGWPLARHPEVFEPESNMMGLLSRGRNVVWRGFPQPVEMFERALHGALRMLLDGERTHYGFLVTDIGAFTTDFGHVQIDASYWDDDPTAPLQIVQRSVHLGVNRLDQAVLEGLSPAARAAIASTAPEQWEKDKAALYSGAVRQLPLRGGGAVRLGEGHEAAFIAGQVQDFARAVLQARSEFLRDHGIRSVHTTLLTGGGVNIPGVHQVLAGRTRGVDANILVDLLDPEEPQRYAQRHEGGSHQAAARRARENYQLVRGGSAIGGCSVFVDWIRGS